MIYVTGDTHGLKDFGKLRSDALQSLNRDDYVIVCGDLGVVFHPSELQEMIDEYSTLDYTVLFVDGNHENFDLLEGYELEVWNGGYVHRISENIIHLIRGQVFNIQGLTFFTFGGGLSYDKDQRTEGLNWWPQEIPDDLEFAEGKRNLKGYDWNVDYVITHDCPLKMLEKVKGVSRKTMSYGVKKSELNTMLQFFADNAVFKRWFFGHYHVDWTFDKYTCVFNDLIRLI
jgi:predicted phosphodiesterase